MHRFYADENGIREGYAVLEPEDARHASRVLRMQAGDAFHLLVNGERYAAEIERINDTEVTCRVLQQLQSTEAQLQITLYQGLPKADKMDMICQKATEIGAVAVVPVAMKRSIVQLSGKDGAKKAERWQKIAREAAKQSGRCTLPKVSEPLTFRQMIAELSDYDGAIVPWEEEHALSLRAYAQSHPGIRRIAVVIGPEGGIAPEEIAAMKTAAVEPVTLGPRILRTETAGIAAMSALLCLSGDME